ncbi:MAG: BMP family ABC transporter substrate-binding protein [Chloroflexota bacterium]|nr:BMP family ABC transporter substrate-binding protein [Chloroflexota bacterium]
MLRKLFLVICLAALALVLALPTLAQDEFVFGMILVGPRDDQGWSQAHYEGGLYVEETVPGARMLVFERLNPADSPETTMLQVVTEMVDQGAQLIYTTSDDFKADTHEVAAAFPDVQFIHASGDGALTGEAPPNVGNTMGQMEWGKMIAGCAAALTTQTGSIGYLGPLINEETRRLTASAYLGARYCYENYRGMSADDLTFTVTWIGFWFNIPGVTLDPTEEANTLLDNGADVLISGIDTRQAIEVAGQRREQGEEVWGIPYDFMDSCGEEGSVTANACLGVPYFHWGPEYKGITEAVIAGTYEQTWTWFGPDWSDLNNLDSSGIGFVKGAALTEENSATLDEFIAMLAEFAAENPENFALWVGPLNYQDGTEMAADGELVDRLDVWYLSQLLEGMIGASE